MTARRHPLGECIAVLTERGLIGKLLRVRSSALLRPCRPPEGLQMTNLPRLSELTLLGYSIRNIICDFWHVQVRLLRTAHSMQRVYL